MSPNPTLSRSGQTTRTLQVLRADVFARFEQALNDAVALDASLSSARTALLTPLRLLDAMAVEAEAALGDDVLAQERLRLLISLAEPHAPPVSLMRSMLATTASSSSAGASPAPGIAAISVTTPPATPPCEPCLLHLGCLTILGLAAGRVGLSVGLAEPMLNNVLGLAIAAGPAETLTRAIATGMSTAQLAAVLSSFTPRDSSSRTVSTAVASFLTNPCEAARWRCLDAVFQQIQRDVISTPWDAAGSGSISNVEPANACTGEVITLQLDPRPDDTDPNPLNGAFYLPLLEKKEAWVLFASETRRPIARRALAVDLETGAVQVRVPSDAIGGWIGFTDPKSVETSNEARLQLRAEWEKRNAAVCLKNAPVPTNAIPLLNALPTPPRTPGGQFSGGEPVISHAAMKPGVVTIGETIEFSWRIEGATDIKIEPSVGSTEPSGSVRITASPDHSIIERVITATNSCGQSTDTRVRARVRARIDEFTLTQNGEAEPLVAGQSLDLRAAISPPDARGPFAVVAGRWVRLTRPVNGQVNVEIPGHVVVDGLVGTLRLLSPDNRIDDERTFGPLRFVAQQQRTVVLVRPGVVGRAFRRATPSEAEGALETAGRRHAQAVRIVEPAWIDDEDLTCLAQPDGPDVPETLRLLERLNILAARHAGLEDALWLAVVPPQQRDEQGFFCIAPAEGARAVAVATPDHIDQLLQSPMPELAPRTQRLRVIGIIGADLSVRIEHLRLEERAAGTGAPVGTDLSVFGMIGKDIRSSHPIRVMSRLRPARIVALMPVTNEFDAMIVARSEFDGDARLALRRIQRVSGKPEVDSALLNEETLSWDYAHSGSARARFTVEVGVDGFWSPIAVVGGCTDSVELALGRIAAAAQPERVRVVASDGWNTDATFAVLLPETVPQHRVLIRAAGQGRYWADLDFDDPEMNEEQIVWTFGRIEKTGFQAQAPVGFTGEITVTVNGPEGELSDRRTAGEGENDRSLRWAQDGTRV